MRTRFEHARSRTALRTANRTKGNPPKHLVGFLQRSKKVVKRILSGAAFLAVASHALAVPIALDPDWKVIYGSGNEAVRLKLSSVVSTTQEGTRHALIDTPARPGGRATNIQYALSVSCRWHAMTPYYATFYQGPFVIGSTEMDGQLVWKASDSRSAARTVAAVCKAELH